MKDNGWTTSHSVAIGVVCNPATTYHYRVRSATNGEPCTVGADRSFTSTDCGSGSLPCFFLGRRKTFSNPMYFHFAPGSNQNEDFIRKPVSRRLYHALGGSLLAEHSRYRLTFTRTATSWITWIVSSFFISIMTLTSSLCPVSLWRGRGQYQKDNPDDSKTTD